ncbi:MAG: Ig-like domain-containing protein [Bacteroidetes bacterium]|nr:Ig-like domain-containing protein [Bacteroidota bacterium]
MKNVCNSIGVLLMVFLCVVFHAQSQTLTRIPYNNQQLFLSGVNMAWMSFANDIGPGSDNYEAFADFFLAVHDSGGNAVRWWLHTDGTVTPEFDAHGFVVGPGSGTIQDLKTILDLAWQREVGIILCLWSFDMLRSSKPAVVLNRNTKLLTDTAYTNAYIRNCLIPMVDSLKGHPAIIAWEIFNEPEGMSTEFGWSEINRVPMSSIQRFVNLCAGAIHRTDPRALVSNGSVSIKTLTDVTPSASVAKISEQQQREIAAYIKQKNNLMASVEEISIHLNRLATLANYNYYSDERLVAVGGDAQGYLDFYMFHYYGADLTSSPFVKSATTWNSSKPLVVGEFHMTTTNGIPKENLYHVLYGNGYAGALSWSWTDNAVSQKTDILKALGAMYRLFKNDIDVNGISGDWPNVTLVYPRNNAQFSSGALITLVARATDTDGIITRVEFIVNDTLLIGIDSTADSTNYYSYTWTGMRDGLYTLKAKVYDDRGNYRTSAKVSIQVGLPPFIRYEAERAVRVGLNMTVKSDPNASGGYFVDVATNAPGTTITWKIVNVLGPGTYPIIFGYNLYYNTPKGQFINVNGVRVTELMFDGPVKVWQEKSINVFLKADTNTIQMEMSWGWMYVDYLAVPREVVTDLEETKEIITEFSLEQNYPNPFNPVTRIRYVIPLKTHVRLTIYDILGRQVCRLVDDILPAGVYTTAWSAANLPSGVYFYRLEAGSFVQSRKMLVLR